MVWVEGVDFAETVFDTNRLSIIRGASRALEALPDAVSQTLRALDAGALQLAAGASLGVYLVSCDELALQSALNKLSAKLAVQGSKATSTTPPFAHLAIHCGVAAVGERGVQGAADAARAQIRVRQLQAPGVRLAPNPDPDAPDAACEWDGVRRAETKQDGPPRPAAEREGAACSTYWLSHATKARWFYGREQKHRLYDEARRSVGSNLRFADELQDMVREPPSDCARPDAGARKLPVSVRNKIAVFHADGDRFTQLREYMKGAATSPERGLQELSAAVRERTTELVTNIVCGLASIDEPAAWAPAETGPGRKLRFETLLFGGDEMTFVAPAWLGWRLALQFYDETRGWFVKAGDEQTRMRFSAGLVFANAKTPIRALRVAAEELCRVAKGAGGGLEIEVLETFEPPVDGVETHRTRLLGPDWRTDGGSRLTIPTDQVEDYYRSLKVFWVDEPFSASLAHRALYQAAEAGKVAGAEADKAARQIFLDRGDRDGVRLREPPDWGAPAPLALKFYQALQLRDYVIGAGAWTDSVLANPQARAAQ